MFKDRDHFVIVIYDALLLLSVFKQTNSELVVKIIGHKAQSVRELCD